MRRDWDYFTEKFKRGHEGRAKAIRKDVRRKMREGRLREGRMRRMKEKFVAKFNKILP